MILRLRSIFIKLKSKSFCEDTWEVVHLYCIHRYAFNPSLYLNYFILRNHSSQTRFRNLMGLPEMDNIFSVCISLYRHLYSKSFVKLRKWYANCFLNGLRLLRREWCFNGSLLGKKLRRVETESKNTCGKRACQ